MKEKLAAVAALGAGAVSPVFAEVPTSVSTALTTAGTDAGTVAGLVIAAIVVIFGFVLMRKALR